MSTKQKCEQLASSLLIGVRKLPNSSVIHMRADLKKFKRKYKVDWHEFHKAGNINFSWADTYEELLEIKQNLKPKKGKKMDDIVEIKVQGVTNKDKGRKSAYKGKTLTAKVSENKRRKGSAGRESLQIIIDNSPITYEAFIAKGGRRQDLAWDIKEGRVEVSG